MLEGVQRMESRRVQPLRLGGCSHLRDFVDDKTDEISYRFPIVNARKLSRSLSFFLFLHSSSLPHLLFFSSLYGIFFRDRECTRVNEQLSDRKERKKEISRPSFLRDFEAIFLFSLHDSSFPSLLSSPLLSTFSALNVSDICPVPIQAGESGLTRDDGRHIIRRSKNISTDEKSIRFLGCLDDRTLLNNRRLLRMKRWIFLIISSLTSNNLIRPFCFVDSNTVSCYLSRRKLRSCSLDR